ncbi:protein scribble homolog isoform X1 [Erpetoichthys calabaricus]|uniref:protein scribble homolog isoform X1 n=1 Tax=Erpetoichthys calabaricus TaxID=27687 RepID=UPI0022343444|nr:protein scribble homolog isoform X1 [Erpetoichthys calabaricus]
MSGIRWASLSGKERLYGGLSSKSGLSSGWSPELSSSPEKEAEEMEDQSEEDSIAKCAGNTAGQDEDAMRRVPPSPVLTEKEKGPPTPMSLKGANLIPHTPSERSPGRAPLKLHIRVSTLNGSLGVSIAGGKGSPPYKENKEGVFISRISRRGAADVVGIKVGDRVLEVNGMNFEDVTHYEAVSALKNAGSSIKIVVLREEPTIMENQQTAKPEVEVAGRLRQYEPEEEEEEDESASWGCPSKYSTEFQLDNRVVGGVCNGDTVGSSMAEDNLTVDSPEASTTNSGAPVVKSTMTIPRIILTHPSTSDEDVEQLTQDPDEDDPDDLDGADTPDGPNYFNHAF